MVNSPAKRKELLTKAINMLVNVKKTESSGYLVKAIRCIEEHRELYHSKKEVPNA